MYFSLDPSRKPGSYFFAETPKNRSTRRIIHLPEDFPVAKKRRMQQEEELEDEMDMDIATGSSRGRSQSVSSAGEELIVSRVATPHDATLRPPSSGINSVASTSTSNSGTTLDSPPPTSLAPAPPSPPISSRRPSSPLPPVRALPVVPIASASSQRPSPVIPPRPPTLPNRPSSNNDEQRTFSPLVIPAPPPPSLFARPKIFQAPHSQSTARAAYSPPLPSTPLGAAPSWTERSSLPPHVSQSGPSTSNQGLLKLSRAAFTPFRSSAKPVRPSQSLRQRSKPLPPLTFTLPDHFHFHLHVTTTSLVSPLSSHSRSSRLCQTSTQALAIARGARRVRTSRLYARRTVGGSGTQRTVWDHVGVDKGARICHDGMRAEARSRFLATRNWDSEAQRSTRSSCWLPTTSTFSSPDFDAIKLTTSPSSRFSTSRSSLRRHRRRRPLSPILPLDRFILRNNPHSRKIHPSSPHPPLIPSLSRQQSTSPFYHRE